LDDMFQDVQDNITENISRLRRVNLADGWDVGVTPDDMADDLLLGLRDGFCGALSSFSSWNAAMVNLMKTDQIGEALVGYMLGIQLPIIAYRFGQHVAVFIFTWRCRFETRRDERRGYGIRLSTNDSSFRDDDDDENGNAVEEGKDLTERKIPSVRAIATALFVMALVTQCTSLSFFHDPDKQLLALSLLFSPLGVLARWRLSKLNGWRPTFPLGTFSCNIIAIALSGSLGKLLAGEPGPRERIVLVSVISGFGGTLSSVAAFIIEILAGLDPILFRFDGLFYAALSIFWAAMVGFLFSSNADWADKTS
jgi:fluoride ion exporter CrcB/FEX